MIRRRADCQHTARVSSLDRLVGGFFVGLGGMVLCITAATAQGIAARQSRSTVEQRCYASVPLLISARNSTYAGDPAARTAWGEERSELLEAACAICIRTCHCSVARSCSAGRRGLTAHSSIRSRKRRNRALVRRAAGAVRPGLWRAFDCCGAGRGLGSHPGPRFTCGDWAGGVVGGGGMAGEVHTTMHHGLEHARIPRGHGCYLQGRAGQGVGTDVAPEHVCSWCL